MRKSCKRWLKEHSLSLTLTAGFFIFSIISYLFAEDVKQFAYDLFMSLGGAAGGAALIFIGQRYLWEKDSDATKPPAKDQNTSD